MKCVARFAQELVGQAGLVGQVGQVAPAFLVPSPKRYGASETASSAVKCLRLCAFASLR